MIFNSDYDCSSEELNRRLLDFIRLYTQGNSQVPPWQTDHQCTSNGSGSLFLVRDVLNVYAILACCLPSFIVRSYYCVIYSLVTFVKWWFPFGSS